MLYISARIFSQLPYTDYFKLNKLVRVFLITCWLFDPCPSQAQDSMSSDHKAILQSAIENSPNLSDAHDFIGRKIQEETEREEHQKKLLGGILGGSFGVAALAGAAWYFRDNIRSKLFKLTHNGGFHPANNAPYSQYTIRQVSDNSVEMRKVVKKPPTKSLMPSGERGTHYGIAKLKSGEDNLYRPQKLNIYDEIEKKTRSHIAKSSARRNQRLQNKLNAHLRVVEETNVSSSRSSRNHVNKTPETKASPVKPSRSHSRSSSVHTRDKPRIERRHGRGTHGYRNHPSARPSSSARSDSSSRCKRSLGGCLPSRNRAPHTKPVATPATARQNMVLLKNASRSTSSLSRAPSTLNLLPSTATRWSTFGMRSGPGFQTVSQLLRAFPKSALRVFGVMFDAATPIAYGTMLGLELAEDIGKWMEQEPYESGLTADDDALNYFLLLTPFMEIIWPRQFRPDFASGNAMDKIHAIKDEAIHLIASDHSNLLSEWDAFLNLPLIGSNPNLSAGHDRKEYPDGSVLYRFSYNKDSIMPIEGELSATLSTGTHTTVVTTRGTSPTTTQADVTISASDAPENTGRSPFFDKWVLGENSDDRIDYYVINKKIAHGTEQVLVHGTAANILMAELDKKEKQYISLVRRINAITYLYQKYVYKTIEDLEQTALNAYTRYKTDNPYGVISLTNTDRRKDPVYWTIYIKYQTQKEKKERASQRKINPVYDEIYEGTKEFTFQLRRLAV